MEITVARHVLRASFRSARELQELLPLMKASCTADEYESYAKAVAHAVAEIALQLTNQIIADFPSLEAEVENDVAAYGRFL